MLLIIHVKKFMCLIFAVWLNHETFLPSKILQPMVHSIYVVTELDLSLP